MNKTLTNLFQSVCLKRAGECSHKCCERDELWDSCTICEGTGYAIDYCPICAKWREKAEKYKLPCPHIEKMDCYTPNKCDTCGYLKKLLPTYTIESIRECMEDIGEQAYRKRPVVQC
jgi:hypothetical protein